MSENFLDLMDDGIEDAKEPTVAEDGEYTLEILDWKVDKEGNVSRSDSNGNPYIMPVFGIADHEDSEYMKNFTHFLRLPHNGLDAKELNSCRYDLKMFFKCFGIDYSQRVDYEETLGLRGDAILVTSPDEGYGEQNRVQKFVAPR